MSKNGRAVTSAHVVAGASEVFVVTSESKRLPATIDKISHSADIAIRNVAAATPNFLRLSSAELSSSGDRVFTVGFPATSVLGTEAKFTEGSISALSGVGNEASLLQVTVPVQPGNSGGPLVTETGAVVGVIAATAAVEAFLKATGSLPQNVNWAVKSDYAAAVGGLPLHKPQALRPVRCNRTHKAGCMSCRGDDSV